MSERLIAAVDALEAIICERYNVRSLTGIGPFAEAMAQARVGNVAPLDVAMAGREMYRWRETADAALAEVHEAAGEHEPVVTEDEAPLAEPKTRKRPVDPTT